MGETVSVVISQVTDTVNERLLLTSAKDFISYHRSAVGRLSIQRGHRDAS